MNFSASMPIVDNPSKILDDPLRSFESYQEKFGNTFLLITDRSLFSKSRDCAGSVAALGADNLKLILNQPDVFGMPESVAIEHDLPVQLSRLNASLFSMVGKEHQQTQKLFSKLLSRHAIATYENHLSRGCQSFLDTWDSNQHINLLSEMRLFVLQVSARVVFGGALDASLKVGSLVQRYFSLRRDYTSGDSSEEKRSQLIETGIELDETLASHINDMKRVSRLRYSGATKSRMLSDESILAKLCEVRTEQGDRLSDQALKTHANVLFMSGSEPIAVAMTWTLLLLSQCPTLRSQIRRGLSGDADKSQLLADERKQALRRLDQVIKESLRMLPPNAIMTRFTRKTTRLADHTIPERSEILLSPYLLHRETTCFEKPDEFNPDRWDSQKVGQYQYMPFGNGHRYCLGRLLASRIMSLGLAALISRYDIRLAEDQSIDWNINVNLMPANDPVMRIDYDNGKGGALQGPLSHLLNFPV